MTHPCVGCGKSIEDYINFCDWECHVEHTKREGGKVQCPNGLPIRCIKADGTMLECEHGDHPDYKFPVVAHYVGRLEPDECEALSKAFGREYTEEEARQSRDELHALIYSDGHVALTLYECTYALWSLSDGLIRAGQMWRKGEWRLNMVSVELIRDYVRREGKT